MHNTQYAGAQPLCISDAGTFQSPILLQLTKIQAPVSNPDELIGSPCWTWGNCFFDHLLSSLSRVKGNNLIESNGKPATLPVTPWRKASHQSPCSREHDFPFAGPIESIGKGLA